MKDGEKSARESAIAAWVGWTKARYGWPAHFAREQANLWLNGVRGVSIHDVTCVSFEKYFYPLCYH